MNSNSHILSTMNKSWNFMLKQVHYKFHKQCSSVFTLSVIREMKIKTLMTDHSKCRGKHKINTDDTKHWQKIQSLIWECEMARTLWEKIITDNNGQYVNNSMWTSRCSSWIRKGRGTRDQIANIRWIIENTREFHNNIYFCFIDYAKAFDCVDHNKLWKILKEMEIPDHLTCLLSNLSCNACQEAPVRTRHEQHTGSKSGKYVKAIYCEFAYLTYMQSTSWKMLD